MFLRASGALYVYIPALWPQRDAPRVQAVKGTLPGTHLQEWLWES